MAIRSRRATSVQVARRVHPRRTLSPVLRIAVRIFFTGVGLRRASCFCGARGAINVVIDGELYTRVWWDANGEGHTITEFYGAGSTDAPYDPMQSARRFLERMQREEGGDVDEAGGRS